MKLKEIHIKGYKSIDGSVGQTIPLGDVTVLLGANGSGKSNLASFFELLRALANDKLKQFVLQQGAERLLYYGTQKTGSIMFKLKLETSLFSATYRVSLLLGYPAVLHVDNEKVSVTPHGTHEEPLAYEIEGGPFTVLEVKESSNGAPVEIKQFMQKIRLYQFHDTSATAKIRERIYVDDAKFLRSDGSNLAAFLKMLKESELYRKYYDRIVRYIRNIMPQFNDFDLATLSGKREDVRLNWVDNSVEDYLFDPGQISDGSLRFMALATLLMQPPELLPSLIILDEPELGLHPAAIVSLAAMIRSAAKHRQVLVATQSTRLVDEFNLDELLVVEHDSDKKCSVFKKLAAEELKEWLERYSVSELWEKNVLGGQP